MKRNNRNIDYIAGLSIVLLFAAIFFADAFNDCRYIIIGYDEGYNATVAANLVRHGKYMVSYPGDIVFYNLVSTGTPVILPTALLYKLFGISNITSCLIPILYSVAGIVLTWVLLRLALKEKISFPGVFSAVATVLLIGSDSFFYHCATHLMGENASYCFLLVCFISIILCYRRNNKIWLFVSGAFLAFSFLTKSAMIFFVVSYYGILFIEALFIKSIKTGDFFRCVAGFAIGFVLLEIYKLYQLGAVSTYIEWWIAELKNMLRQSSGIDRYFSIGSKIEYLEAIFGANKYICLAMIALPVLAYFYHLISAVIKRDRSLDNADLSMVTAGICSASLLVFFVLLGGSGLVYARRHAVNELFVRLFAAFFLLSCLGKKETDTAKPQIAIKLFAAIMLMLCVCPPGLLAVNAKELTVKKTQPDYDLQMMNEFLSEVDQIDENGNIYCYGWWQEPDVALFLDRKMKDLSAYKTGEENAYFIVGRRFDGMSAEDLGLRLERIDNVGFDPDKLELFSSKELFKIYKILG